MLNQQLFVLLQRSESLNAYRLRQKAFFINHKGAFGCMIGMIILIGSSQGFV